MVLKLRVAGTQQRKFEGAHRWFCQAVFALLPLPLFFRGLQTFHMNSAKLSVCSLHRSAYYYTVLEKIASKLCETLRCIFSQFCRWSTSWNYFLLLLELFFASLSNILVVTQTKCIIVANTAFDCSTIELHCRQGKPSGLRPPVNAHAGATGFTSLSERLVDDATPAYDGRTL